ncbi:MAG TPA: type I secretion system permease/ATPase [Rhodospirillaceae bacterium]|nr:type I secretion system permease/ATPase [Rhodospirillaceae bacterium]
MDLRAALIPCRAALWAAGAFSLAESMMMLTVPLFTFQVFDRVLTSRSQDTLALLTLAALAALALLSVFDLLRGEILQRIGLWLDARLSPQLLAAGYLAPPGDARSAQGLRDLAQLRGFIGSGAAAAFFDAPMVPVFIAVVFFIHPLLGWISLGGAACLMGLATTNLLVTRRRLSTANMVSITALNRAQSAMATADAVRAMGMLEPICRRWQEVNGGVLGLQADAGDRIGQFAAASKFARLTVQVLSMGAGASLAMDGHITGGMMIAASIIMARGLAPIEIAVGGWSSFAGARESWRRIDSMLAMVPPTAGKLALPEPAGDLLVDRVTYFTPGGRPVIKNICLAVAAGEALGVIGATAAGKTTLARLLVGALAPSAGSVRLDGAELCHWDPARLGPHIGYLPQDVQLIPGSVAENIARLGEPESRSVVEAARRAGVHDLILRLPQGYDTRIEEDGLRLSGGQRQRVGLARALYGRPRLVVLDEPNSNLDLAGEQALLGALAALRGDGATVILISHRPAVLECMDKILVLRDGGSDAFGPRESLLPQLMRPPRPPTPLAPLAAGREG